MAEEEKEGTEEKKRSSKMLIIIVVGVLLAIGAGVGAFFALGGSGDSASEDSQGEGEEHVKGEPAHIGPLFALDPFILNLGARGKFLKVSIELELYGEEMPADFVNYKALVGDRIIRTLSRRSPEELLTVEGKDSVRTELVTVLNNSLGKVMHLEESEEESEEKKDSEHGEGEQEGPKIIKQIYFTEFIVQ